MTAPGRQPPFYLTLERVAEAARRRLPPRFRRSAWRLLYLPVDLLDLVLGRRSALVPPRGKIFIGAGEFTEVGQEFLGYFQRYFGLGRRAKVLDVGCGIGRMAVPLTDYLEPPGSYDGFDVAKGDIRWCRRNISRRFPHFRFHWVDVYNREYNPGGRLESATFRFPFPSATFDFAFATSVFTHLLPDTVENYIGEVSRVLKPGALFLSTFFLMDDFSRSIVEKRALELRFTPIGGGAYVHDRSNPEVAVAYEEDRLSDLFATVGLEFVEPILYGSWSGRADPLSFQDILIARRCAAMTGRGGAE